MKRWQNTRSGIVHIEIGGGLLCGAEHTEAYESTRLKLGVCKRCAAASRSNKQGRLLFRRHPRGFWKKYAQRLEVEVMTLKKQLTKKGNQNELR